ncbi:MmgE/PrpD family protein [Acetonema longum DSM 6540]|uniref:MmgE/PrpD family protein n=2 Tax=Acetonema TaxID=2373 RepID=F7NJ68_9FIRM|nr:MmgE/PrpD family protein [Acetonema longum DSM 6540]
MEAIPAEVKEQAKKCLLDFLGCAIRGAVMPQAKCIKEYAAVMGGNAHASILGVSSLNSIVNAALANGYFGHILEMDDVDKESISHPATVVMPAALSIGEWRRSKGAELLEAIVAGYEVMLRIGTSVTPAHYQIWHTTATTGVFGAAIAAGRMLKLNQEQMSWAFGSAGTMAAGLWEFLSDGAMSKYLHAGKAASTGVLAAQLAASGLTGASRILEGRQGFFAGYARQDIEQKLFQDFHVKYRTATVSFKPYPCCRHTHSAIDCARSLYLQAQSVLSDIKQIHIHTYQAATQVACFEDPLDSRQGQFSLKYCMVRALINGNIGLDDFSQDKLTDKAVRALMAKTSVAVDAEIDRQTPIAWPCRLSLELADGRVLHEYVAYPKGDPENPLSWEEVETKFRLLVEPILEERAIPAIIDMCKNIELLADCGEMIRRINDYGRF